MQAEAEPADRSWEPVSQPDWGGRATRAEVNLDAIAGNIAGLARLAPGSACMAVVKADAYGHGAVAVAETALAHGATWLGVYAASEGVELRKAGIQARILIFGPFQRAEAHLIVRYGLTPTVHTVEAGEWLQQSAAGTKVPFHLKIDTGLARAGIAPSDAVGFMCRLAELPSLEPQGLYTHFARADEPGRPETQEQFRTFLRTWTDLTNAGFRFTVRHTANSAATLSAPETHLDLVRCGISTYGYYPSPDTPRRADLRPALSLLSIISRLHGVPAGSGVGYGHEFRCRRPTMIALVPIGYGDGIPRALGNGAGRVLVRGVPAPVVGRVSMDQITVDVTDVPRARAGDGVTLLGTQRGASHTAEDMAAETGTISYDIVTGLLPRVPRIYTRGGKIVGTKGAVTA